MSRQDWSVENAISRVGDRHTLPGGIPVASYGCGHEPLSTIGWDGITYQISNLMTLSSKRHSEQRVIIDHAVNRGD